MRSRPRTTSLKSLCQRRSPRCSRVSKARCRSGSMVLLPAFHIDVANNDCWLTCGLTSGHSRFLFLVSVLAI
ncbi:hypothetical protein M406DRAFT_358669 [Cryphonectria parasitica EP155]|uniref:Uncharacterized protein n=1 Tax=Cryphonectria parasitica (strain ATCC 38755 / EP155) TaxID=660469 RepID=A0A9P4XSB9_CRYP1|nr:uncharacterized protein M406DRAFT_358669 [Cryphonectria parasitica EP155]KAF3759983.1 hypothetical protein M406DRAFT_358669 [Cryphonectria parasitica EP155]